MLYIAMLLSILAGVSLVFARMVNASLAKEVGLLTGTFYNYVVGLFVSLLFLVFSKESSTPFHLSFNIVPLWAYLGGVLGVVVVTVSSYLSPKISAFYLTLLIFIGQLFTGIIIDFFTLNELSIGKVFGGILVLVGLSYNLVLDQNREENPTSFSKVESI
ncbi:protein of unknown function DUF606 [Alkaliphilus metalliredigens QYMF]|uniref:EamA domain-containing protein n=1 Tax=Alkaliphilus metalliredigens (strain QYMF) TaxID=293826 RepID=A6TN22_ALKMQ|nr:DMT family transporter [Alkaliphilus metalliredigens]ABR47590.1 protein of unknown function DUF606 [Alkaliphilus metalliredigens QYMF]